MDHDSLVSQVKQIQRTDATAKVQWGDYCDTHLGGVRDPSRHDAVVLNDFINAYQTGALPPPSADAGKGKAVCGKGGGICGKGSFGGWGAGTVGGCGWGSGGMGTKGGKGIVGGGGGYVGATTYGAGSTTTGGSDVMEFVKTGQRTSPSFKLAWQAYCTNYGTGKYDPKGYDRDYLAGFIEYIGGLASKDLGAETVLGSEALESIAGQKRPVPFTGGPAAKRHNAGTEDMDPEKAELVNRVKAVQRADDRGKEAWHSYCDTNNNGIRDPSRHEVESLRKFLLERGE